MTVIVGQIPRRCTGDSSQRDGVLQQDDKNTMETEYGNDKEDFQRTENKKGTLTQIEEKTRHITRKEVVESLTLTWHSEDQKGKGKQ